MFSIAIFRRNNDVRRFRSTDIVNANWQWNRFIFQATNTLQKIFLFADHFRCVFCVHRKRVYSSSTKLQWAGRHRVSLTHRLLLNTGLWMWFFSETSNKRLQYWSGMGDGRSNASRYAAIMRLRLAQPWFQRTFPNFGEMEGTSWLKCHSTYSQAWAKDDLLFFPLFFYNKMKIHN